MAHQPAISFSISLQHPFNRAGGRTSNVREKFNEIWARCRHLFRCHIPRARSLAGDHLVQTFQHLEASRGARHGVQV
jgi:hypothetical protein